VGHGAISVDAHLADVGRIALLGGAGVLAGALAMIAWGGPRRLRMRGVLLSTLAYGCFAVLIGVRPSLVVIAVGVFGMLAWITVLNGIYTTIVQVKVPQRFHGRVFAIQTLIAWSTLPIGFGLVAPNAAGLLNPLLAKGGALAPTVGQLIGTGPGRGIGPPSRRCSTPRDRRRSIRPAPAPSNSPTSAASTARKRKRSASSRSRSR
jgi:hypothetical protein